MMLFLTRCLGPSQVPDLFDFCNKGLDIIPLTVDWSQITGYLSSPLMWGLILAVSIALVFFVPLGILQAISNFQVGLNVVTELVAGYVFPGKPIANMTFKVFGYMTLSKGLSFAGDLKLGHYMHVPPIMLFSVQPFGADLSMWRVVLGVGQRRWHMHFTRCSKLWVPQGDSVLHKLCRMGSSGTSENV